jgi:lipoprotein-anchoring transpeptidase ErfK/SrfK
VSLKTKQAWLLDGAGHVTMGPVPAGPGSAAFPTPRGTFHVLSKERIHLSREFNNAPMPYSVFFYPGDAFHSGSPRIASHGCVHLANATAAKFFSILQVGDLVQVV